MEPELSIWGELFGSIQDLQEKAMWFAEGLYPLRVFR